MDVAVGYIHGVIKALQGPKNPKTQTPHPKNPKP